MKDLIATCLKYQNNQLLILDQRQLPQSQHWQLCESDDDLVSLIQSLAIRGAPAIGIAAVIWIGHLADSGIPTSELINSIHKLRVARPTAVNLMNYLDQMLEAIEQGADNTAISIMAEALFGEDVALCHLMANHGATLVPDKAKILTHCNTGGLATVGIGTAIGVITTAHEQGKQIHVWVDETRPLLQGGRLTAWDMQQADIPYQIICDNMAAMLMAKNEVDMILVGADRIAVNGDFANKIGTYSLAVLAKHHGVPFYVVAPHTTVDKQCADGDAIPIEQRAAEEVRGVSGNYGHCQGYYQWTPANAPVFNPAFDVTPAYLVTGWILDKGVFNQQEVDAGALVC